jgi:choloylglycine hydrolase
MKRNLPVWLAFGLASMTLLAPSAARPCTTFLATHAGQPVFGKDYDWIENAGLVVSNPHGLQKTALMLSAGDSPAVWTSKYGSLTFNQYGIEMPNAGVNEKGLVVEIMWLNSSQYPTPDTRPSVNELQWIQRALDLFATVAELAQDAPSLRVARAYANVHYLACDSSADCAAFEYINGQLVITRANDMPAKALANDTYAASAVYLAGFTGFGGLAAMPTSTSSLDRFARASILAETTTGTSIPDSAFGILDSVSQSSTMWSIVYALKDGKVYFRTKAVPKVKFVGLATLSFTCGVRKILNIDTDSTGDVGASFVEYTVKANQELLGRTMAAMASELPAGALDLVVAYPDTCKCASGAGIGGAQGGGGAGAGGSDGSGGVVGGSGGSGLSSSGSSAGSASSGSGGSASSGSSSGGNSGARGSSATTSTGCSCRVGNVCGHSGTLLIVGLLVAVFSFRRQRAHRIG